MLFRCEVCKTFCTTQKALNKHFLSSSHKSKLKEDDAKTSKTTSSTTVAASSDKMHGKQNAVTDDSLSLKIVKVESIKLDEMNAFENFTSDLTTSSSPQGSTRGINEVGDLEISDDLLVKDEYNLGTDDDDNSFVFGGNFSDDMIVIDDGFDGINNEMSQKDPLISLALLEDESKDEINLPESTVTNLLADLSHELSDNENSNQINSPGCCNLEKESLGSSLLAADDAKKSNTTANERKTEEIIDNHVDNENKPENATNDDDVNQTVTNSCQSKTSLGKENSECESETTEELNECATNMRIESTDDLDEMTDMMCNGEWEVKDEIDDDEDECNSVDDSFEGVSHEKRESVNNDCLQTAEAKDDGRSDDEIEANLNSSIDANLSNDHAKLSDERTSDNIADTFQSKLKAAGPTKPNAESSDLNLASNLQADLDSNSTSLIEPIERENSDENKDLNSSASIVEKSCTPSKLVAGAKSNSTSSTNHGELGKTESDNDSNGHAKLEGESKEKQNNEKNRSVPRKKRRLSDNDKDGASTYVSKILNDVATCLIDDGFYLDDSDDSQLDGDESDKNISSEFSPIHSPEDNAMLLDDVSVEDFKMTDTISETSLLDDVSDFSDISDLIEMSDISDVDVREFENLVGEETMAKKIQNLNDFDESAERKLTLEQNSYSDTLKIIVNKAQLKPLTVTLTRLKDSSLSQWIKNSQSNLNLKCKERLRITDDQIRNEPDEKIGEGNKTKCDASVTKEIARESTGKLKNKKLSSRSSSPKSSNVKKCRMNDLVSERTAKLAKTWNLTNTVDFGRNVIPVTEAASKLSNYKIPKKAAVKQEESSPRKNESKLDREKRKVATDDVKSGLKKKQSSDSTDGRRPQSSRSNRSPDSDEKERRNSRVKRKDEHLHRQSSSIDRRKISSKESHKIVDKGEREKELHTRVRHSPSRSARDRYRNRRRERSRERSLKDQDLRSERDQDLRRLKRDQTYVQCDKRVPDNDRSQMSSYKSEWKRNETESILSTDKKKEQSPIDYFSDYWKVCQPKANVDVENNRFKDADSRGYYWAREPGHLEKCEWRDRVDQTRPMREKCDLERNESQLATQIRQEVPYAQNRVGASPDEDECRRYVYKSESIDFWSRELHQTALRFQKDSSDGKSAFEDDRQIGSRACSQSNWSESRVGSDYDRCDQLRSSLINSEKSASTAKEISSAQVSTTLQDLLACVLTIPTLEQIDKDTTETIKRNILTKLSDHLQELKSAHVQSVAVNLKPTGTRSLAPKAPSPPRLLRKETHYQQEQQQREERVAMPSYVRSPDARIGASMSSSLSSSSSTNETLLADFQKQQIAQELAAVLTVTGRTQLSEDLLQRLVQQAISSKLTRPVQQRCNYARERRSSESVPVDYPSASRECQRESWSYTSDAENVARNNLYLRRDGSAEGRNFSDSRQTVASTLDRSSVGSSYDAQYARPGATVRESNCSPVCDYNQFSRVDRPDPFLFQNGSNWCYQNNPNQF